MKAILLHGESYPFAKQSKSYSQKEPIMAQLNSILGSILRDIIAAQHEANLYSLSLSESYGKDGRTRDFHLPSVSISDMELNLRYAVTSDTVEQKEQNISFTRLRQFIKELSADLAKTTIQSTCNTVLNTTIPRSPEHKQFFVRLKESTEVNHNFRRFLSRQIQRNFDGALYEAVDTSTGEIKPESIINRCLNAVRLRFLDDEDLTELFDGKDGKKLRDKIEQNLRSALRPMVIHAADGKNFRRMKTFPKLDVAVTADELMHVPEDAIHTFKLKFSPSVCDLTELDYEQDDYDIKNA